MFDRRFFAEAVTLVILAAICGSVANVVAARDRKLSWVGDYPNATVVPKSRPAVTDPVTPSATSTEAIENQDPVSAEPAIAETNMVSEPAAEPAPTSTSPAPSTPTVDPPTKATQAPAPKPRKQFLPTPDKVSVDITNEDAKQLFDDGALFLDARRTGAFAEGHIPGAKSFAVWEADVDDKVNALFYEVTDQRQPIVVYCTGGNCEDSHMLAQKLWGIGYENVLVYTDGFPGWLSIKGPVER